MPIYLDDRIVHFAGDNLANILQTATKELESSGRIVVEVVLNGDKLAGESLTNQAAASMDGEELRLYTADASELAVGALNQAREMLQSAREAQASAAELLQQDEPAKAMQQVSVFVTTWQQVLEAVLQSCQICGVNLDEKSHEGRPMPELTDELVTQLTQVRDLIRDQDLLALADVLQYEWPDISTRWDAVVGEVIGWVQKDA